MGSLDLQNQLSMKTGCHDAAQSEPLPQAYHRRG
jgi:hypothetical protein